MVKLNQIWYVLSSKRSPRVRQEITLNSNCLPSRAETRSELNTPQIGDVEITDPDGNTRVTGIYDLESLTLGSKKVTGDQIRAARALASRGIDPTIALSYVTDGIPVNYNVHYSGGRAGWKGLAALVLGGAAILFSGCGGGGSGGGDTDQSHPPNSPTNTKPSISGVEFSPRNPLVNEYFTATINASDDTTPASDLKYEIIIDEDKKGAFDDAAVTGTDTTLPVTLHFSPNAKNGTYQIKVTIWDRAGIQNNGEYIITTTPHNFLKDGTVVEGNYRKYGGSSLIHARAYFNNLGFDNEVTDLDKILTGLSATETLTGFDVDLANNIVGLFVNDSSPTEYGDNDNNHQGDWAGGTEVDHLTASDLNDYLTQPITAGESISHAGYYFNFDPSNPHIPASNSYVSGTNPQNPDVSKVYIQPPSGAVLPGAGTISADLVVEYANANGLIKIIVFDPSAADKLLIDYFKNRSTYDPATLRIDVLEGSDITRASLDIILYEK